MPASVCLQKRISQLIVISRTGSPTSPTGTLRLAALVSNQTLNGRRVCTEGSHSESSQFMMGGCPRTEQRWYGFTVFLNCFWHNRRMSNSVTIYKNIRSVVHFLFSCFTVVPDHFVVAYLFFPAVYYMYAFALKYMNESGVTLIINTI